MNEQHNKFIHMFYEMSSDFKRVRSDIDGLIAKSNGRKIQADLKRLKLDLDTIYNFIVPILEGKK